MTRVSEVPSSRVAVPRVQVRRNRLPVGFNRHHILSRYYMALKKKRKERNTHRRGTGKLARALVNYDSRPSMSIIIPVINNHGIHTKYVSAISFNVSVGTEHFSLAR